MFKEYLRRLTLAICYFYIVPVAAMYKARELDKPVIRFQVAADLNIADISDIVSERDLRFT